MSEKNSFWEWLGYTRTPNWGKARGLGGFVGATALLVALALFVASIAIIAKFVFAAVSVGTNSEDVQNLGLLLGAILGAPFVAWRSLATKNRLTLQNKFT
ncbi:hypothetical protein [Celeribacter sp.]|uniref:hypothetical protein n=1 Tax=Celeribacter sp. TaxID=1890673 RepID=UPI003A8CF70B